MAELGGSDTDFDMVSTSSRSGHSSATPPMQTSQSPSPLPPRSPLSMNSDQLLAFRQIQSVASGNDGNHNHRQQPPRIYHEPQVPDAPPNLEPDRGWVGVLLYVTKAASELLKDDAKMQEWHEAMGIPGPYPHPYFEEMKERDLGMFVGIGEVDEHGGKWREMKVRISNSFK